MIKAVIKIRLKEGVLDPQGKAIEKSLGQLGFDGIKGVRQGKLIEVELDETDRAKAEQQLDEMCTKLLANMVVENYDIEIEMAA